MSCADEFERWKVDLVGKFFGVGAGADAELEGDDDDEGRGEEEKRTNEKTIGKVDWDYNQVLNTDVNERVLADSLLNSGLADEESFLKHQQGVPVMKESSMRGNPAKTRDVEDDCTKKEDSNDSKFSENFIMPKVQASEASEEIIDLMLDSKLNAEFAAKKEDLTEPIDASNVTFAYQDVRLNPGFVMPVNVTKPKIVIKKVVVDTFYDDLAAPGENVIIPDVAEETWIEGTDEEFGQEVADKLKEDKVDVIVSLVEKLGRDVVLDFFWEIQKIEESGGLMIMNGARRRSSGGVLFHLLRGTKDEQIRAKVELFFEERQTSDSRKNKAASVLKKKIVTGVKDRSLSEKDLVKKGNELDQEEVFDIRGLIES